MLQLTHAAAIELGGTIRAQGLPTSAGVRVFGRPGADGELALGLALVELPAEDDQVTEREGTRLFVAPDVAGPLSSSAIDIVPSTDGAKLVIVEQDGSAD